MNDVKRAHPRRWTWGLWLAAWTLLAGFGLLTSEMLEAETLPLDIHLLQWAQNWRLRHPGVESVMRDFSGLGGAWVLTAMTVIVVGHLWITRRPIRACWMALAMAGGAILVRVLKATIGRERPAPAFAAFLQDGLSFPSGHASMSAIFFMTVAVLLAEPRHRTVERLYILLVGAALAGLVGFSRIALGVHWATDVIGGWMFGLGWACVCLLVVHRWVEGGFQFSAVSRHQRRSISSTSGTASATQVQP